MKFLCRFFGHDTDVYWILPCFGDGGIEFCKRCKVYETLEVGGIIFVGVEDT